MSVFHHNTGFSQTSQLLFMFQCNEHVEMNKFLCSFACTWMTIIDSQFYIIDSLTLDVSLERYCDEVRKCEEIIFVKTILVQRLAKVFALEYVCWFNLYA